MLPGCAGVIVLTALEGMNCPNVVWLRALALATTLRSIESVGLKGAIPVAYYDPEGLIVSATEIESTWRDDLMIALPEQDETVPTWVGRVAPGFSVLDLTGSRASFAEVVALMNLGPNARRESGFRGQ